MTESVDVDRERAGWWLVGVVLSAALLLVLVEFVGTFVFGVFIYYSTRPVYTRLKRRVHPPNLAAAIALLLLALPALLIVAYALAIGIQELVRISRTANLGQYDEVVQEYATLSEFARQPEQLLRDAGGMDTLQALLDSALTSLGVVATGLLHLFVMIAIAFYLLRDDHRLSRWFRSCFADDRGVLDAYLTEVDRDLNAVFFGNILNAIITGTIGAITYSLIDLIAPPELTIPFAALLGLLAGIASLVPIVGMKLVYVPVTAYMLARAALTDGTALLWFPIAFFAVSFVVVDTIPDLVLRPYVSGRSLHVGMVMFAYILGPLMFGWYGIFLGPMLLVFVVHFFRIVVPELLTGERIRPYAVDPTYLTDPATYAAGPLTGDPGVAPTSSESESDDPATSEPTGHETNDGADERGE